MGLIKKYWMKFSLRKKIIVSFVWIIMIILVTEGMIVFSSQTSLTQYRTLLKNNTVYHELQEMIKKEQETFIAYMRQPTEENRVSFEKACVECNLCIMALPFDYTELGEERYARTWNIVNGYEGYKKYRNMIMYKTEFDPDYVESLYQVLGMQDNLAAYSLRIAQETFNQLNDVQEAQMRALHMIPFVIFCVTAGMILFLVGIERLISASMLEPLLLVAEDARQVTVNNFHSPDVVVANEDEIGELVHAFNKMKHSMKDYIETLKEKSRITDLLHKEEMEKVEMEKSLETARLEILKQQVNPHFLFNTLSMISGMAKLEDADTTDRMIISLANLFRYNLQTVEQEVYLEEELKVVDHYIYIQQMRFDNRIQYRKMIYVDETAVLIPSFTLQPIVENAFMHGISFREEGGTITLKVREKEGRLIITVADNGCGMSEERLKEVNERVHQVRNTGRGIGLGNICKRVDTMFTDGVFKILSKEGKGTVIWMEIPRKDKKGDGNV